MFMRIYFTDLLLVHFNRRMERFLENIIDSDLEGLNETSHLVAHRCILARSELSWSAARRGSSTIM